MTQRGWSEGAMSTEYAGLLFIGDLHLASRAPGFRKDDYPRAILKKLAWAIRYARAQRLVPVILGDMFDFPRDNANWLLVELLGLFDPPILAIVGNHDCKENTLGENDTLSVLVASGHVRLLEEQRPWRAVIGGTEVVLCGFGWGTKLPKAHDRSNLPAGEPACVIWVSHHDLRFPGYEQAGRFSCRELEGVDLVVNGHIHRSLADVVCGRTTWVNPGNIARVKRSDASRSHVPSVLRVDVEAGTWRKQRIELPHEPFEAVFHPELESEQVEIDESVFIRELRSLESIRTAGGAGLKKFLDANLNQFDARVAAQIRALAEEVKSATGSWSVRRRPPRPT